MKKYSYIILLLFATISYSQIKLTGKVTNEHNEPIQNVHLHILKYDADTNSEGYFEFNSLPEGTFNLFATHIGYEKFQTKVTITSGENNISFSLVSKVNFIEEVHIEKISHSTRNVVNSNKIKSSFIEKVADKPFSEALKEVSGVSSLKSGNSVKPMINGLHSSRVTILNNNIRLEDQQWGIDHAPNLDLNAVGKISIIKGSNALQYSGDAVGGLVIVEPLEIKKDTLLGRSIASYNSNGRGGGFSTSIYKGNEKGFSYDLNASMKYFGDKVAPKYVLSNTGMRDLAFSSNLYFKTDKYKWNTFISYFKTKIGILRAAHTGSSIDLYNSITNQIPSYIQPFTYTINYPRQEVSHSIAKLALDMNHWKFQYAFQFNDRLEFDLRRGTNADKPALSLGLTSHSFLTDWYKDFESIKIKTGLTVAYQSNSARPETNIRPLIPNFTRFDSGFYGIINKQFNDRLSGEFGIRFDYSNIEATKFYLKSRWLTLNYDDLFPQFYIREDNNQILMNPKFNYFNTSSSIGINYYFSDHWNWLPGLSLVMRNPNPAELFSDGLHHATGMIELGSLSLKKEKGVKLYSPIKFSNEKIEIEFNPYLNLFSNFIYAEPQEVASTIRGDFLVWNYKQAKAQIYGIDVASNYQINSHLNYKFRGSMLNGYNQTEDEPLIDMSPLNIVNELSYSINSLGNAQFAIKSEYVGRKNNVPNNNFMINVVQNNQLVPALVDVSSAPKAYHLIHFESQFEPKLFNTIKTTLNFSISNVLNTSYRDYLNRQRFFADEMGRNFKIQFKVNY